MISTTAATMITQVSTVTVRLRGAGLGFVRVWRGSSGSNRRHSLRARGPAPVAGAGVWLAGDCALAASVGTVLAANRASIRICMRREVMVHSALQVCRTVPVGGREGSGGFQPQPWRRHLNASTTLVTTEEPMRATTLRVLLLALL